jgi:hypothetical protein
MPAILDKVWFVLKIGITMIVFFGVVAFIYKFYLQYKVRITLHKKIGRDSSEVTTDMAKIIVDEQNKTKLVLFKTRKGKKQPVTCPVPEAIYKGKRGKFDHYYLHLDDNMELHPIMPPKAEENFEKLVIRPQERAAWGRMEDERLYKKYQKKDLLMKYAAPLIVTTACITAFLIFFFASKEIGAGLQSLASQMGQIAMSCTRLSG